MTAVMAGTGSGSVLVGEPPTTSGTSGILEESMKSRAWVGVSLVRIASVYLLSDAADSPAV